MENAIIKTLSYFDLFNQPLTLKELRMFLWGKVCENEKEFEIAWQNLLATSRIENSGEYYFLPGRLEIVSKRRKSSEATIGKLKIARRAAKLIRSVPFVRAIFACNSVGAGAATAESDIDLFVITAPGRIWIVRLFTNLILRFFGMRTYGERRADKICLSFFVDFNHLNFSSWRVANDDVYLAYWLYQLTALYDPDSHYERLLAANGWAREFLPNASKRAENFSESHISRLGAGWRNVWEKMWGKAYGDLLEKQAKAFQWQKLKLSLKDAAGRGDGAVIIKEGIIKLHENDRRAEYREKWNAKTAS